MKEVLAEGLRMHREEKASLMEELKANERCAFNDKDLENMDLDHLKKLSKLGNVPSYEGQEGNVKLNAGSEDGDKIPDAPIAFEPKK